VASAFACVALLVSGCSDDAETKVPDTDPPPPDHACVAGELALEDGGCLPAGLPPDMGPCAAGETLGDDGACRPAGIPTCGSGFEPDGDGGCNAILPASCADGHMAIPGDTRCRPVVPCAEGPWGDAPVDPGTQYVDASYPGSDSDGSAAKPWKTIQAAIAAAAPNGLVAIGAGIYTESLLIDQHPVALWGRCPGSTAIAAPTGSGVRVSGGVQGVEIHDLAITGGSVGVDVRAGTAVSLERVWLHDTGDRGIEAASNATLTVRGTLFERTKLAAVYSIGAHALIEASELRDTLPLSGVGGRGIYIEATASVRPEVSIRRSTVRNTLDAALSVVGSDVHMQECLIRATGTGAALSGVAVYATDDLGEPSSVTIDASVIEQSIYAAIATRGSTLAITSSAIRGTASLPNGDGGWGVAADESLSPSHVTISSSVVERNAGTGLNAIASDLTVDSTIVRLGAEDDETAPAAGVIVSGLAGADPDAKLTVRGSVIDRVRDVGIGVFAATATIETTVVRDTQLGPGGGAGMVISEHLDSGAPSSAVVRTSRIERSRKYGIAVFGSEVRIESTLVADTTRSAANEGGWGIVLSSYSRPAKATLRSCLLERNQRIGVAAMSAEVAIEATKIDDTLAAAEGSGVGLYVAAFSEIDVPAQVTLTGSIVQRSKATGIHVVGSSLQIDATIASDTATRPDGAYGDGIVIVQHNLPTTARISNSLVARNARTGIGVWGGTLTLADTQNECNGIDLASFKTSAPTTFEDLGGNLCGCNKPESCAVESTNLSIPEPPTGPPLDPGN
jgi:hypothetical protein